MAGADSLLARETNSPPAARPAVPHDPTGVLEMAVAAFYRTDVADSLRYLVVFAVFPSPIMADNMVDFLAVSGCFVTDVTAELTSSPEDFLSCSAILRCAPAGP
jgi:hypothetical protein